MKKQLQFKLKDSIGNVIDIDFKLKVIHRKRTNKCRTQYGINTGN